MICRLRRICCVGKPCSLHVHSVIDIRVPAPNKAWFLFVGEDLVIQFLFIALLLLLPSLLQVLLLLLLDAPPHLLQSLPSSNPL